MEGGGPDGTSAWGVGEEAGVSENVTGETM